MYSTHALIQTRKGQTFLFKLTNVEVKLGFLRNKKETSVSLFKTFLSYLKVPNGRLLLLLSKVLIDLTSNASSVRLDCVPYV